VLILDNYKNMGKIIITENQKKSIVNTVFKYFDENFTPDVPWDVAEKEILKYGDAPTEYNLHQDDSGYHYLSYEDYSKLNKIFGPIWKSLFIDWFNSKMENVVIMDVFNMYH